MSENTTNSASLKVSHTPGPWEFRVNAYGYAEVTAKTKRGLCKAICRVGGFFRNDREANARLIAAAPELLDALRTVVRSLTVPSLSDYRADSARAELLKFAPEIIAYIKTAEAAILKAEGSK